MIKLLIVFTFFLFFTLTSIAQANFSSVRECRVSGGIGIANSSENSISIGSTIWGQLSYRFAPKVSIATEFENMTYKQPGFYETAPTDFNRNILYDNNVSLLFKYHFLNTERNRVAVSSGWTYCIRQIEYYEPSYGGNQTSWNMRLWTFSDYRIPLLIEYERPLFKTMNVQARMKYNLASNGSTYSAGIGVSLRL